MAWVRISDDFYDHPKFIESGPLGLAVWIAALAYCNRNLTDGVISYSVAKRLIDFEGLAYEVGGNDLMCTMESDCMPLAIQLLVDSGLWHEAGHECDRCPQPPAKHLVFHDYLDFQPSAEQIAATREGRSEAGKRGAAARWNSKSHGKTHGNGHGKSHGKSDGKSMPPTPTPTPTPEEAKASSSEIRDDVARLCEHLASRIEGNGSKRPTITRAWLDAARLLIDKDGRTEEQVHTCIDWCQDSEFWRPNILSMPKLREKYDQLRLKAQEQAGKADRQARPLQPVPSYEVPPPPEGVLDEWEGA